VIDPMPNCETADEIRGEAKAALVDLLYRLADDDLVIGHRNSEWTGLAPILEADIAFSSIAQDQMGQAAAYYRLLHELGEPDPDGNAFLRDAGQFRCCALVGLERRDWAFSTVRLFLYEVAKGLRIDALCASSYRPLADLAKKLRGEQKYHSMHAEMWIRKLGDATDESHRLMQGALDELYGHGLGMFEPTEADETLAQSGISVRERELRCQWESAVAPVLADAGLEVPEAPQAIYGGRHGRHPDALKDLLASMQQVFQLDPTAKW